MNALYFYRSLLKKVRSQLGEPAHLHMNSPFQCNFFPYNATYFTRIKVNVCYASVVIFMVDVFYINFGKNGFSSLIFFCNQGHTFCDMSSLRGSALRTFLYHCGAPIFCLNWWSTKVITMSPKSVSFILWWSADMKLAFIFFSLVFYLVMVPEQFGEQ